MLCKKRLFYYVVSGTVFPLITLIFKRFELLMPDWFQMREIFMLFMNYEREQKPIDIYFRNKRRKIAFFCIFCNLASHMIKVSNFCQKVIRIDEQ